MATDPADAALIIRSLEIAAEQVGDLTDGVYRRLFERQAASRALFWRDADNAIKGQMLARVFEAIIDFVGERRYAHRLIQCEVVTHEGYEVPRDAFAAFFEVAAETVRDACGRGWTPSMQSAWDRLLSDLNFYVVHPDQYATN
jgi:hemoglobin-like flavoprotein